MARLVQILLLISLITLVWTSPLPDHEPGHHKEEKTDQDHDHPLLEGANAKKDGEDSVTTEKSRTARDTEKEDKQKTNEHSSEHKDAAVSGDQHGPKKAVSLSNAPGPFLLQGVPIQTHISSSDESSEEKKSKSKRESEPYPHPPATVKGVPLWQQPHLDPTPPPGYKPKFQRDTESHPKLSEQQRTAALGAAGIDEPSHQGHQHDSTQNKKEKRDTEKQQRQHKASQQQRTLALGGVDEPSHQGHQHDSTQNKKEKRDTEKQQGQHATLSTGPLQPHEHQHFHTEDGRPGAVALPPRPGGPQSPQPKQKRDTDQQGHQPTLNTGPLEQHSPSHFQTEDGREGVVALPPRPGAPQSPQSKQKRESPIGGKVEPATLTKDEEDKKKEEHKQKRDSYSLNPKEKGSDLHQSGQAHGSAPQLTPPVHESQYNRHARDTEKQTPKSAEHSAEENKKSDKKHDDHKDESSDAKHA